ncbi:MAG: hypothetical protein AB1846_05455 [Chloroflexota bacterium]
MKRARPFGVTLLALIVLSLSALNLVRFGTAIAQWEVLAEFAPTPGPLYILLTGLAWVAVGLPLFAGLWLGRPLGRRAVLPASLAYLAYYWLDRLLFQVRPPQSNWPFALAVTIAVLFFVSTVTFHPKSRNFFKRESHDR